MPSRLVLNRAGVRSILKSPGVLADLTARANRVASVAGPGHIVDSEIGPNRARASVRTDTFAAAKREAESRNLTRAIDAAR
jgi:hypothetical protein